MIVIYSGMGIVNISIFNPVLVVKKAVVFFSQPVNITNYMYYGFSLQLKQCQAAVVTDSVFIF